MGNWVENDRFNVKQWLCVIFFSGIIFLIYLCALAATWRSWKVGFE